MVTLIRNAFSIAFILSNCFFFMAFKTFSKFKISQLITIILELNKNANVNKIKYLQVCRLPSVISERNVQRIQRGLQPIEMI